MWQQTFVSIGANIGPIFPIFEKVSQQLEQCSHIRSLLWSPFYETSAISTDSQPNYINAIVQFETQFSPDELLLFLQQLERLHGRHEKGTLAPRTLDLDIILMGNLYIATEQLSIPHPKFLERLFVLVPMSALCSSIWVPSMTEHGNYIVLSEQIALIQRTTNQLIQPSFLDMISSPYLR